MAPNDFDDSYDSEYADATSTRGGDDDIDLGICWYSESESESEEAVPVQIENDNNMAFGEEPNLDQPENTIPQAFAASPPSFAEHTEVTHPEVANHGFGGFHPPPLPPAPHIFAEDQAPQHSGRVVAVVKKHNQHSGLVAGSFTTRHELVFEHQDGEVHEGKNSGIETQDFSDAAFAFTAHGPAVSANKEHLDAAVTAEFVGGIVPVPIGRPLARQVEAQQSAGAKHAPSQKYAPEQAFVFQDDYAAEDDYAAHDEDAMPPGWRPTEWRDHFDYNGLFHRFIITRWARAEFMARFKDHWYVLSCPGCGANSWQNGAPIRSVLKMLEHIRTAHPEWAPLADPKTERAFFELLAHDGRAFDRMSMWKISQGVVPFPTSVRKVGDLHHPRFYGRPRGPIGSPGISGPPALASLAGPFAAPLAARPTPFAHPSASNHHKLGTSDLPLRSGRESFLPRHTASPATTTAAGKDARRPIFIEDDETSDDGDSNDGLSLSGETAMGAASKAAEVAKIHADTSIIKPIKKMLEQKRSRGSEDGNQGPTEEASDAALKRPKV